MSTRYISPLAPAVFAAPFAVTSSAAPGHELIDLSSLGLFSPVAGGAQGYNVQADVITQTVDGRDLNDMWNEFSEVVRIYNERRQRLIDLLTFPVTNVIEDVPQVAGDDFEEASEFGVPKGIRGTLNYFSLAYDFKWYDLAARFTWKYLAEATAAQVESVHQSALDADSRLVFKKVMNTLFNNANRIASINGQNYTVYALYNADGTVPPEYKGNTFNGTHSHYLVSGAAGIDSGDLEDQIEHLRHHGYSPANGTQLFTMVNPAEARVIRSWRANTTNANAAVALYDFVPAQGQPALIVPNADGLLGTQVAGNFRGMNVIGSYGPTIIIEEDYIPAGYMVTIGSGGEGALMNPVGLREHAQPGLRGLRQIPGDRSAYPLVNSYYSRGFGTGIRQRGGTVITQIKASGSYAVPAMYS